MNTLARLFSVLCLLIGIVLIASDQEARPWIFSQTSTPVTNVSFSSNPLAYNNGYPSKYIGGDTWYSTWADDGKVYVASNDTFGWNCTQASPCPSGGRNILFSRLTSPVDGTTTGTAVNTMDAWGTQGQSGSDNATYKSTGLISVNGTLYLSVRRLPNFNTCSTPFTWGSQIIKSSDHGATWTPTPPSTAQPYASPMFTAQNFQFHVFVQYTNKDYVGNTVDNSNTYVYAISPVFAFSGTSDPHILGRVKISNIGNLSASDWSWYTGGDGMLDANWSSNIANAAAVASGNLSITSVQYFPALNRYLALGYSTVAVDCSGLASNDTVTVSLEAPHPWGPWTIVQTNESFPQGHYFPSFVMNAVSGRAATVLWSGDFNTSGVTPPSAVSGNYYTLWLLQIVLNDYPTVGPTGSCAQSTQFFARAGTLDTTHHNAYDNLICGMVTDGTWPLLDALYIFATQNSTAAALNLVKFGTLTVTGSPAFQTDRGYTGDDSAFGPADYLSLPYMLDQAGNNFTLNNGHISAWVTTNNAASNGGDIMGEGFSITEEIADTYKDGLFYGALNDGNSAQNGTGGLSVSTRIGHWMVNRTGASLDQIFQNGSVFATPNATASGVNVCSTPQSAGFFAVLGKYICSASPVVQRGTPNQVAMVSAGAGMTSAQATSFYNRLRTYMTAVGVP